MGNIWLGFQKISFAAGPLHVARSLAHNPILHSSSCIVSGRERGVRPPIQSALFSYLSRKCKLAQSRPVVGELVCYSLGSRRRIGLVLSSSCRDPDILRHLVKVRGSDWVCLCQDDVVVLRVSRTHSVRIAERGTRSRLRASLCQGHQTWAVSCNKTWPKAHSLKPFSIKLLSHQSHLAQVKIRWPRNRLTLPFAKTNRFPASPRRDVSGR